MFQDTLNLLLPGDCPWFCKKLAFCRHCLWIFGNEATLKSSGSVWKKLVHDARVRGCFHDAQNDKDLVKAMAAALIDIDLLDIKIRLYSVLFQGTRWKVCSLSF